MQYTIRESPEWWQQRQEDFRRRLKPLTDWLAHVMLFAPTIYYIKTGNGLERIPSALETYIMDEIQKERAAFFAEYNIPFQ